VLLFVLALDAVDVGQERGVESGEDVGLSLADGQRERPFADAEGVGGAARLGDLALDDLLVAGRHLEQPAAVEGEELLVVVAAIPELEGGEANGEATGTGLLGAIVLEEDLAPADLAVVGHAVDLVVADVGGEGLEALVGLFERSRGGRGRRRRKAGPAAGDRRGCTRQRRNARRHENMMRG
jgi:hypothetical protein